MTQPGRIFTTAAYTAVSLTIETPVRVSDRFAVPLAALVKRIACAADTRQCDLVLPTG